MKKIIFGILISSIGWGSSLGFAVNENIMVRFCVPDDPKVGEATAWRLDVPAGLIGTFCMDAINLRDEPMTMRLAVVDGEKTESGLGSCWLEGEIERFGKYVSGIPNEVTLWPKESRRFQPTIQFPDTLTGEQYGCIAYFDAGQLSGGEGISMIYRYAHVIWANLTPPLKRSLTTQYPQDVLFPPKQHVPGFLSIAEWSGVMAVELINTGTIDSRVAAKCEVTTYWRGTHTYSAIITKDVPSGQKEVLVCSLPIDAKMTLQATARMTLAYSSLGIADQPLIKIPEEYTEIREIHLQRKQFFLPKVLLAGLIIISLLTIVGVRKFKFLSTHK